MTLCAARIARICIVALSVAAVGGCNQGEGVVSGGPLVIDDCQRKGGTAEFDPFQLNLNFMALERDEDVVLMRFGTDALWFPLEEDTLAVTVEDFSQLRAEVETGGSTRRTQEDGLRLGMTLGERCPNSQAPLIARFIDARFDAFSVDGGDRVAFNIIFDLFDERSGEQVGWNLVADGDFEVVLGTPYQVFSDPDAQKH